MPRETFHQELREIDEAMIQMATLVESAIARSMQSLTQRDRILAGEVISGDAAINDLQLSIRTHTISVMARQSPVARDLRYLITAQLVINELERMGDHAAGIARQAIRMLDYPPIGGAVMGELSELCGLVRDQVRGGIQAFIDINVRMCRQVSEHDDDVDRSYRKVFSQIVDAMSQDTSIIPAGTSLLFVAHDLERIGDRVTNICEDIVYMVTGEVEELN